MIRLEHDEILYGLILELRRFSACRGLLSCGLEQQFTELSSLHTNEYCAAAGFVV